MVCSEGIVCWAIKRIGGGTGAYMYVSEEREMDKRRDREHGGKHGRMGFRTESRLGNSPGFRMRRRLRNSQACRMKCGTRNRMRCWTKF